MRAARCRRDDHGEVIVSWVVLMPVLVLLMLIGLQLAIYFAGRGVAEAAARAGAREARILAADDEGWQVAAVDRAGERIDQLAPALFDEVAITAVAPDTGLVGVRVEAEMPSPLPDILAPLLSTVSVTSAGPVEQFVPDLP